MMGDDGLADLPRHPQRKVATPAAPLNFWMAPSLALQTVQTAAGPRMRAMPPRIGVSDLIEGGSRRDSGAGYEAPEDDMYWPDALLGCSTAGNASRRAGAAGGVDGAGGAGLPGLVPRGTIPRSGKAAAQEEDMWPDELLCGTGQGAGGASSQPARRGSLHSARARAEKEAKPASPKQSAEDNLWPDALLSGLGASGAASAAASTAPARRSVLASHALEPPKDEAWPSFFSLLPGLLRGTLSRCDQAAIQRVTLQPLVTHAATMRVAQARLEEGFLQERWCRLRKRRRLCRAFQGRLPLSRRVARQVPPEPTDCGPRGSEVCGRPP